MRWSSAPSRSCCSASAGVLVGAERLLLLLEPLGDRSDEARPPPSGTSRTTPRRRRTPRPCVGAQCTIVNVAAGSFMNLPDGLDALRRGPCGRGRCSSTSSSGGTPTVNEQRPMPWRPISSCPSGLLVAPKIGGCGSWSGFGCTRRGPPMCQYLPVGLVVLLGPRADDVAERLPPHLARLVGVDVEALELQARRRATGPEVDAPVGEQVEHRGRLGAADRVVVRASAAGGRRSRCGCSSSAPRSRRRAPRGSSSASTPRGSGAPRSRTRGSRPRRRGSPARGCSCTRACSLPGVKGFGTGIS